MNYARSCLLFIVLAASMTFIQVNVAKEATRGIPAVGEHDVSIRSNHSKPEIRIDSPVCNPHWKVAMPQHINNDTSLPVHRYM